MLPSLEPAKSELRLRVEFYVRMRQDTRRDRFHLDPPDIRQVRWVPEHRGEAAAGRDAGVGGAPPICALLPDRESAARMCL